MRVALVREQLEDREVQNYLPLREHGIDVVIVTAQTHGPYSASGLGLEVRRLNSLHGRLPSMLRREHVLHATRRLRDPDDLLGFDDAVADCDVLCVNELHMASSAQAVRLKARRPDLRVVTVVYENIPFRYDESTLLRSRRAAVRQGTDRFVALTETAARALRLEGTPADRMVTFPYGVDASRFEHSRPSRTNDDVVTFLFAGRLLSEKGLVPLLLALHQVDRRARLRIIGSGPEEPRMRSVIDTLGLHDRVELSRWVPYAEMPRVYASADCFVLPSLPCPYWEEQLGFAAIEAMMAGLPIISTTSGSIPDVVGDAGLLVAPYDVDALAHAMTDVLDSRRRGQLGDAARARAITAFDARHQGALLAEAFRTTMSTGGGSR